MQSALGGPDPRHRGINRGIRLGGRGCEKPILRGSDRRQGDQRGRREQRGPHDLCPPLAHPDLDQENEYHKSGQGSKWRKGTYKPKRA